MSENGPVSAVDDPSGVCLSGISVAAVLRRKQVQKFVDSTCVIEDSVQSLLDRSTFSLGKG